MAKRTFIDDNLYDLKVLSSAGEYGMVAVGAVAAFIPQVLIQAIQGLGMLPNGTPEQIDQYKRSVTYSDLGGMVIGGIIGIYGNYGLKNNAVRNFGLGAAGESVAKLAVDAGQGNFLL